MAYTLPADVGERPVAVDGAGTLGRRIAAVYAAGGSQVRIFDPSPDQCDAAIAFCTEQVDDFKETLGLAPARDRRRGGRGRPGGRRARRVDGRRSRARAARTEA
jgi:3-hydroxyacyl-CoA dehydrogenase